MLWEELREELLFVPMTAADDREVLRILGHAMVERGYAEEPYVQALLRREQSYPTGLDLQGIGVAIPHTDSGYIRKEGVAIALLEQPVLFRKMGAENSRVPVRLVILFTVPDSNRHIGRLQTILQIIQDREALESLLRVSDSRQMIEEIRKKETGECS